MTSSPREAVRLNRPRASPRRAARAGRDGHQRPGGTVFDSRASTGARGDRYVRATRPAPAERRRRTQTCPKARPGGPCAPRAGPSSRRGPLQKRDGETVVSAGGDPPSPRLRPDWATAPGDDERRRRARRRLRLAARDRRGLPFGAPCVIAATELTGSAPRGVRLPLRRRDPDARRPGLSPRATGAGFSAPARGRFEDVASRLLGRDAPTGGRRSASPWGRSLELRCRCVSGAGRTGRRPLAPVPGGRLLLDAAPRPREEERNRPSGLEGMA
jgi:hypothetical protein